MARKRMFDMEIVDTDLFLDMPQSTQNLYFHLGMRADDDGFVSNPKKIAKVIGANEDDLKLLLLKKFILNFENGVIVIRHWKLNNYLRSDRYTETIYKDEKRQLTTDENGVYNFGIPDDNHLPTTGIHSIEENSKEKNRREENIYTDEISEIIDFLNARACTNYRSTTKETQKLIITRLKDGYTVDQFKDVIDKKANEWIGTDMEKFLRPVTLFGNKFEGYLNARIVVQQNKQASNIKGASFADIV